MKTLFCIIFSLLLFSNDNVYAQKERAAWSKEKANEWYANKGWLRGSNFIPSTAINQLEMWQSKTFDPKTIDRELGYAQSIGFNVTRVFTWYFTESSSR